MCIGCSDSSGITCEGDEAVLVPSTAEDEWPAELMLTRVRGVGMVPLDDERPSE